MYLNVKLITNYNVNNSSYYKTIVSFGFQVL